MRKYYEYRVHYSDIESESHITHTCCDAVHNATEPERRNTRYLLIVLIKFSYMHSQGRYEVSKVRVKEVTPSTSGKRPDTVY